MKERKEGLSSNFSKYKIEAPTSAVSKNGKYPSKTRVIGCPQDAPPAVKSGFGLWRKELASRFAEPSPNV